MFHFAQHDFFRTTQELLFDKLNAAVLGSSSFGRIIGDGNVRAFAHSAQIKSIDAQALKRLYDGFCSLLRKRVVHGI